MVFSSDTWFKKQKQNWNAAHVAPFYLCEGGSSSLSLLKVVRHSSVTELFSESGSLIFICLLSYLFLSGNRRLFLPFFNVCHLFALEKSPKFGYSLTPLAPEIHKIIKLFWNFNRRVKKKKATLDDGAQNSYKKQISIVVAFILF